MKQFHKTYSATVFLLGMLLLFVNISCGSNNKPKNIVVGDAIRFLRREAPFHLEGFGMVRNIDYEGNYVLFQMQIYEDDTYGLNVNKISSKQTVAKKIVSAQIGMMNKQMKDAMMNIAEQSYGLRVVMNGSNSNQGIINLSPDEIKTALSNTPNKTPEDFSLEMLALSIKLILPAQVDQRTTWNDTRMTDTSFEYIYIINDENINLDAVDLSVLKKEKITTLRRQNTDSMRKVVNLCKSTHRNLVIRFIGYHSNKKIDIVLTPSDLEKI